MKFSGAYPLPWGMQVSAVFMNIPGTPIQARYVARNQEIAQSLGRNLGQCRGSSTCNGTVTINLIEPNTMFEDRQNQLDVRLSKIISVGGIRVHPRVDVYNLLNAASVLSANAGFGSTWRRPNSILAARLVKFGAQVDF